MDSNEGSEATAGKWRILAFPLIAFVLIIADQMSKRTAESSGPHILNPGISFGLFKNVASINEIMIVVASIALIVFIYFLAFRSEDFHSQAGLILLISGTAGNLIDRITTGAVIDFISIGSFPTFNFADAYLTIGIVIIIIMTFRWERQHPEEQTA